MLAFLLAASALLPVALAASVPLTLLTDPKARCLDGSQAGYYFQPSSSPKGQDKWVIYLNGGGECDTEASCKAQLSNAMGSSKYMAQSTDAAYWYLASDSCSDNPDLCDWNHAYDPYCTQDLHSGQVTAPSPSTWGLYFAGHHVLVAILDALDKQPQGLGNATDIVLHGMSAGGIGVWTAVDYLAARYPRAHVTAATVAGHYFYATYYTGPYATCTGAGAGGMADFRESAWPATAALYQAYVDEDCAAAQTALGRSPGLCMLSNTSLPFISSDAYVVQALTDQTVLTGHDCWPESHMHEAEEQAFMGQWYSNMTVALRPLLMEEGSSSSSSSSSKSKGRRSGVFAAACYTHVGFTAAHPLVGGLNYYEAFGNFYFRRTPPLRYNLVDDCGELMCNPTCNA